MNIKFETLPTQLQRTEQGVQIEYQEDGQTQSLTADYVLVATGRRSYLDQLQLKNIKTLTPMGIVFSSPEIASVVQKYKTEISKHCIHNRFCFL